MSKAISYYDWTLTFKKNDTNHNSVSTKPKINSIGLKESEFKEHLKTWKAKNLK